MRTVAVPVRGQADDVLLLGLRDLEPVLEALDGHVMVIGGLMTRIWLHATPAELPVRGTADIDLGIDRRSLGLGSDSAKVVSLLEAQGFKPGAVDPEERFRFGKSIDDELLIVDVLVAPGSSREEPPLLEGRTRSLAAPGLAYALLRGIEKTEVRFVGDHDTHRFLLPMPALDAAFVLKAALAESGVRRRPDRRTADTTDSLLLAAAVLKNESSLAALREHRRRTDVRKAIRWLTTSFQKPGSVHMARVSEYFAEQGVEVDPAYGVRVASAVSEELGG